MNKSLEKKMSLSEILDSHFENCDEIFQLNKLNNPNHLKTNTGRLVRESTIYHISPTNGLFDLDNLLKFMSSDVVFKLKKSILPIGFNNFSKNEGKLFLGSLVYEEPYKNFPTSNVSTIVIFPSHKVYSSVNIDDSIKNGIDLNYLNSIKPKSKVKKLFNSILSVYAH